MDNGSFNKIRSGVRGGKKMREYVRANALQNRNLFTIIPTKPNDESERQI